MSSNPPQDEKPTTALLPPPEGSTYAEKRGGNVHLVNRDTGKTEMIVSSSTPGVPLELIEVELPDGTRCLVQRSLAPTVKTTWDAPFNSVTVDLMCQKVLDGYGLTEVCEMDGFPTYVTFARWRREHPWVDAALQRARVDRAERYRDEVLREAKGAQSSKDPINATNTKIDALKWAAGIDDPSRYSPKAKIEGVVGAPTQIIINTGINRDPLVVSPPLELGANDEQDKK